MAHRVYRDFPRGRGKDRVKRSAEVLRKVPRPRRPRTRRRRQWQRYQTGLIRKLQKLQERQKNPYYSVHFANVLCYVNNGIKTNKKFLKIR
jgi:hypothetical protein